MIYPTQTRNYCVFDEANIKRNINDIKLSLENPKSEEGVLEDLYALNLMLDKGNDSVAELLSDIIKIQQHKITKYSDFLSRNLP